VPAGVDETKVGLGARGPHREEGCEVLDGEVLRDGDRECCGRAFVSLMASYWGDGRGRRPTVASNVLHKDLHGLSGGRWLWRGGSRHDARFGELVVVMASGMEMLGGDNVV